MRIQNTDTTDQKLILKEIERFYKALYTTKFKTNEEYHINRDNRAFNMLPKLSSVDRDNIETAITMTELSKASNEFENNKSPGCDGLTKEFYKFFWPELGPKFLETYNYCK